MLLCATTSRQIVETQKDSTRSQCVFGVANGISSLVPHKHNNLQPRQTVFSMV